MPNKLFFPVLLGAAVCCLLGSGCKQSDKATSTAAVFEKLDASSTGIDFQNLVDENYEKNYFDSFAYVYNGAGVAVGDINNDGLQDIYFTGNEVPNKLYLN